MTTKEIDKLFEKASQSAARKIDNNGTRPPKTKSKTAKKPTKKK